MGTKTIFYKLSVVFRCFCGPATQRRKIEIVWVWAVKGRSVLKIPSVKKKQFRSGILSILHPHRSFLVPLWWQYSSSVGMSLQHGTFQVLVLFSLPLRWLSLPSARAKPSTWSISSDQSVRIQLCSVYVDSQMIRSGARPLLPPRDFSIPSTGLSESSFSPQISLQTSKHMKKFSLLDYWQ